MAQFDIVKLSKSYGSVEVLHEIDLTINQGEFLVLVGPSGSGKSTLLRMLAGLEDVTSGVIAHDGRPVTNLPPQELNLAMVFQDYALYPHMSVRDNISFGMRIRKMDKATINTRVDEAAAILGLEPYLDRRPSALSGGQRQRVAMGRAMVRHPVAYLFDEPLSNLDAKLRVQMRSEIVAMQRRVGATAIYVTHDQTEAMTMGDRIVLLKDGRIEQLGTPSEIYGNPSNLFVAGFIGTPPMNVLAVGEADGLDPDILKIATSLDAGYIGIRPENLHVRVEDKSYSIKLTNADVHIVGSSTQVWGDIGSNRIEAAIPTPIEGHPESIELKLSRSALYLFDKAGSIIDPSKYR